MAASAIGFEGSAVTNADGQPEIGERDGYVGFAATERGHELGRLQEALQARRRESEHQFTEGYDLVRHIGVQLRLSNGEGCCAARPCKRYHVESV